MSPSPQPSGQQLGSQDPLTNTSGLKNRSLLPGPEWWTWLSLDMCTFCSAAKTKLLNASSTIHNNVSCTVFTVNPVRRESQRACFQKACKLVINHDCGRGVLDCISALLLFSVILIFLWPVVLFCYLPCFCFCYWVLGSSMGFVNSQVTKWCL